VSKAALSLAAWTTAEPMGASTRRQRPLFGISRSTTPSSAASPAKGSAILYAGKKNQSFYLRLCNMLLRLIAFGIVALVINVALLHDRIAEQQRAENSTRQLEKQELKEPERDHSQKGFSACLLIKDDNDLLNEWLAYHTHVLDLRYLVVAIDPSSETSPTPIFDRWRNLTDLKIIEWSDTDFMPSSFLRKGYHIPPKEIDGDAEKSPWHQGHEDPATVIADNLRISNHRFRQKTFLASCLKHMRWHKKTWTMHVDTDEFVVVNPLLRNTTQKNVAMLHIGPVEEKHSLWKVIKQIYDHDVLRSKANYPCISMPRLLFGSAEFDNSTITEQTSAFDPFRFETVRWNYHTDYNDTDRNAQPKVIVDVSQVLPKDEMFKDPFSIHRPSRKLCRRIDQLNFRQLQRYPITVNHYTGSWERYNSKNDTRRSERAYNFKANVSDGFDDWLAPWLQGFVESHGEEKAKRLLQEYVADD